MTDPVSPHGAPPESDPGPALAAAAPDARFESFEAFWPFYLSQHEHPTSRRLHVVGTGLAMLCLFMVLWEGLRDGFGWLLLAPLVGYGFAWVGHFAFEKNRPATFTYPLWSLAGDLRLFRETVTGQRPF